MSTLKIEKKDMFMAFKPSFSDYDLSLVCISKCEDELLECVSTCSSSECILKCNRALVVCSDCEFLTITIKIKSLQAEIISF